MLLQQAGLRASACGQPQLVASTSPRCTPPCLTSGGRAWRGAWSKSKQGGRRAPCARVAAWGGLGKLMGGGGEEAGSAPAPSLPTTQFPPYQVIYKTSDYDLRLYEVYPVVTMPYERREEVRGQLRRRGRQGTPPRPLGPQLKQASRLTHRRAVRTRHPAHRATARWAATSTAATPRAPSLPTRSL